MRRHVGEGGRGLAGGGRRVDVDNPVPDPTPEQLQLAKQADRIREMERLMRCAVGFSRGESSQ
jgi:hypothetical protein